MNKKKKYIKIISFLLFAAIFICTVVWGKAEERIEPENPLAEEADFLRVDIRQKNGGSAQSEEVGLTGEESQEGETQEEKVSDNQDRETDEGQKNESDEDSDKEQSENPGEDADKEQSEKPGEDSDEGQEENPSEAPDKEQGEKLGEALDKEQGKKPGEDSDEGKGENPGDDIDDGKKDNPGENGGTEIEDPGNGDEDNENEPGLVTNLYNRIITVPELEEDRFEFYVYYSDPSVNANIRVNYRHKNDKGSGTYLKAEQEKYYQAELSLGTNYITIYFTDKDGKRNYTRYVITYQAEKAAEENPSVGEHPPVITTTFDNWEGDIKTNEFTFVVTAKTWRGETIYADNIEVKMDGQPITNPTGSGNYEYVLQFERPNVGDYSNHVVTVLAWDNEGNSRWVKYDIRYHAHDEGNEIGNVYVVIDATTVGCGIVDECEIEIKSGDTAAVAVLEALEQNGYEVSYGGNLQTELYLRSISRADAFRGCEIDSRLGTLLERDGVAFTPKGTRDKLGEFDFTQGSGWLYFINGTLCPGKAMSSWKLNGGETISLRYTLAWGKDMGVASYDKGSLTSYCAAWVDGSIHELGHDFVETGRVEAAEGQDGYIEYTCTKCQEVKQEIIEAPENPDPEEPENPEVPVDPAEPERPEEPEEPENPEEPDGSGEPGDPENPQPEQ